MIASVIWAKTPFEVCVMETNACSAGIDGYNVMECFHETGCLPTRIFFVRNGHLISQKLTSHSNRSSEPGPTRIWLRATAASKACENNVTALRKVRVPVYIAFACVLFSALLYWSLLPGRLAPIGL